MRATKDDCFPLQIFSSEGQKGKKIPLCYFYGLWNNNLCLPVESTCTVSSPFSALLSI